MTNKLFKFFRKFKIPRNFCKKLIYYNNFIYNYSTTQKYLLGGGKNNKQDIDIKKEKIKFDNYTFIILSYYEDGDYIIKLETNDKINCFLIILSSLVDYAYINNISNYKNCSCEGKTLVYFVL